MAKKKTIEQFIQEAKAIHGDKYNYDQSKYNGSFCKIKIWCNTCKEFFYPLANSHLQGVGCKRCSINKRTKTQKQFIYEAKKIHKDKYNYDYVKYVNSNIKVKIYCNKCKRYFEQIPARHLKGAGCPYCAGKNRTTESFIEEAKAIHGNKYNYDHVVYEKYRTKVKIYCKKCQQYFLQAPEDHLDGKGCPFCRQSKGETYIFNWLNKNNISFISQYKFENCRDKRPLPFDFYLPDYNMCIEFQGEQHFINKKYFNKNKQSNFIVLQKHDQIKKEYCKTNNIKLLEITYKDNINEKLKGCNF